MKQAHEHNNIAMKQDSSATTTESKGKLERSVSRVSCERRDGRCFIPFEYPILRNIRTAGAQHPTPFQHHYHHRYPHAPPSIAMAPFDFHPESFHIPPSDSFEDGVVDVKPSTSPSQYQHRHTHHTTHHYYHEQYYPYDPNYPHPDQCYQPHSSLEGSAPNQGGRHAFAANIRDDVSDNGDVESSASTPLRSNQTTRELPDARRCLHSMPREDGQESFKHPKTDTSSDRDTNHTDYGYFPGYDFHHRYYDDYYHHQQGYCANETPFGYNKKSTQWNSRRPSTNASYHQDRCSQHPYYHDARRHDEPFDWRYGEDPGFYSYPALAPTPLDDQEDDDVIPVPPPPYSPVALKAPPKVTPSSHTAIRKKVSEDTEGDMDSAILKPSSHNHTYEVKHGSQLFPALATIKESHLASSPPKKTNSSRSKYVNLQDTDIVVGRGAPTNYHIGNEYFRQLVSEYRTTYFCSKRSEKPLLAMQILDILKQGGSRFVRRQKGGTQVGASWVVVDDKLAYEKVCAALREGAPEVQQRLMSSTQKIRETIAQEREQKRVEKENGCN